MWDDEREDGEARFLALGDSYTFGEGVVEEERWTEQLVRLLRAEGRAITSPRTIARTGWTTDELVAAIEEERPSGPYELVTLMIGVNDQYRERPVETFLACFTALLERAMELAGGKPGRVVVLSVPDWGVTPFAEGRDRAAVAEEIDAYNAAARVVVEGRGGRWEDVTELSRERGGEPVMLAPDGLHPSGAMYAQWARAVLPAARLALA